MLNRTLARKQRLWLEITQEQVANQIGVDRVTVWNWERGHGEPTASKVVAWAKVIQLQPGALLVDPDAEPVAETTPATTAHRSAS